MRVCVFVIIILEGNQLLSSQANKKKKKKKKNANANDRERTKKISQNITTQAYKILII